MMKHGDTPVVSESGFIVVETNYRIYAYTSTYLCLHKYISVLTWVHVVSVVCTYTVPVQMSWLNSHLVKLSLSPGISVGVLMIMWFHYYCNGS